ncbi:Ribosomal large subunit pseudouridine synthase B [Chitinispirillum alkaliphilum]|nr:Ribosomal large subunit pseudouridine synthase B [Chitinispirillum alkaliphilum]
MQGERTEGQSEKVRLNRFLAMSGLGSRRKCDEIIASGRIFVNGEKVTELGGKVDPSSDRVEYMGKALSVIRKMEYLVYYKPIGVIVTRNDPEGRVTVYEDIAKKGIDPTNLKYVGRLDYNSEGLLIMTNDGDLIHALTHPRFGIKKVYEVKTRKCLTNDQQRSLIEGVESKGQLLRAGNIVDISREKHESCWYRIDLFEGKNRQIRRMLEVVGDEVMRLKRVQFSSVKLGNMKPGDIRSATEREIGGLRNTGFKK